MQSLPCGKVKIPLDGSLGDPTIVTIKTAANNSGHK